MSTTTERHRCEDTSHSDYDLLTVTDDHGDAATFHVTPSDVIVRANDNPHKWGGVRLDAEDLGPLFRTVAEHVDGMADVVLDLARDLGGNAPPTRQVPTYHGIQFAQCFTCGYGTADTTTLEVWNDGGGICPGCNAETRVLWVNTGGRVAVTGENPDGTLTLSELRLGTPDGTPPDAPGTITGPELDTVPRHCGHDACHQRRTCAYGA